MPDQHDPHIDLGGYVLGVLDPDETAAFETHLAGCGACQRELGELRSVAALLDDAEPPVDVPEGLEARTFAAIEAAAAAPPVAEPSPRRRARHVARPHRMIELRKVAAAAAAVVVLGVGSAVVRETTRPTPAVAQVIELTAPGRGTARAVAKVRATETGGVIEMDVEGLDPLPPGSYFECWLVAAEGDSPANPKRVSVGTFTVDKSGHASVRWDFKADVAKFPRMGITVEPDDGNPVQTTERVLGATRLLSAR